MAIIKIKAIKKRMDHVIDYVDDENKTLNESYGKNNSLNNVLVYAEDDYKTNNNFYVTGINCNSEDAYNQMQITKSNYNKQDGILGFHIVHSFNEGEVTPDLAHKIGVELAEELFGDRFEVVVCTHLNTKKYHNHIVLNSVSFKDGKKYYDTKENYAIMRKVSNNICKSYGLKTMEEKECKSKINYDNFYKKYLSRNTVKKDIDNAIKISHSFEEFKQILNQKDYEINVRADKISIKNKHAKRNIRIERAFGDEYSIQNIKNRIHKKSSIILQENNNYKIKKYISIHGEIYKKKKVKGLIFLYYHYYYLLRVFQNNTGKNKLSNYMKQEVKKLDEYSKEARFLNSNNIVTKDELNLFKINKKEELKKLLNERENSYRCKINYDKRIELTSEIKKIRNEIKICENIEKRVQNMKENLEEKNNKEKEGKEKNKNERFK